MRRVALVCWLVVLGALLGAGTCGGGDGQKGVGDPCTRRSECMHGLECQGGVCRDPSADAGVPDGDAAVVDAG